MVTPGNSANRAQPETPRSTGATGIDALTITQLPSIPTRPFARPGPRGHVRPVDGVDYGQVPTERLPPTPQSVVDELPWSAGLRAGNW